MQFDPDPTRDIALNEKREANIGGKWVQCTPTGRRPAIKAVIDGEEPMPSRGYPGEPIRRKRAAASWSTYRRTRSGVMTAWNQAVNEANPRLNRFHPVQDDRVQGPAGIRAASGPIPDTSFPRARGATWIAGAADDVEWDAPRAGIHARHRSEDLPRGTSPAATGCGVLVPSRPQCSTVDSRAGREGPRVDVSARRRRLPRFQPLRACGSGHRRQDAVPVSP